MRAPNGRKMSFSLSAHVLLTFLSLKKNSPLHLDHGRVVKRNKKHNTKPEERGRKMEAPAMNNIEDLPGRPIVTSGESSSDADWHDEEDHDDDENHDILRLPSSSANNNKNSPNGGSGGDDLLYDENADDEDEAYVYKNLRSGTLDDVQVKKRNNNLQQLQQQQLQVQHLKALKPRHSDAVLSCPCCFNIVCMDCQRHEKYPDQFRAMFVMNIMVKWHKKLRYDESARGLVQVESGDTYTHNNNSGSAAAVSANNTSNVVPPDPTSHTQQQKGDSNNNNTESNTEYFTVCCANCETQVAALDMNDEVYHFYGCLSSS